MTCICRSAKKTLTHSIGLKKKKSRFFGAFRHKGGLKTRYFVSKKIHLGSSQKMFFFPLRFARFLCIAFLGRFVTRGVQKRD
jgi:hypothetical protein